MTTTTTTLEPPILTPYLLMAVASAVLMATIGIVSRVTGLAAETVTFYRLFLGALLMLGWLQASGRLYLLRQRPSVKLALNGALLAGFILCYVQAMNYTTMANAIMMIYLAPVVAAVGAHLWLNERLTWQSSTLIALALLGFAMMMEFSVSLGGGSHATTGLLFGAASTLCYAAFMLVNRTLPASTDGYSKTFYQLLFGALVMLPFVLRAGESVAIEQWGWLLAAGLFPGFLGILFAVSALQQLPAATFGTLAYLEPIAVVTFGWVLFGETLNLLQLAGCATIIASGVLQGLHARRRSY
ncbi:DMT family transporter [Motiliproteus sediminis]|uniref:DMT family transporter n=1 Tax=Motiliproteus sediminis TaxID=1468178 RepID=UPI001AEF97BA|nr:EamA family transporter [Motiliproteus sediminis]